MKLIVIVSCDAMNLDFPTFLLIFTSSILVGHGENTLQCYNGTVTSAYTVELKSCKRKTIVSSSTVAPSHLNNTMNSTLITSIISPNHCSIFRHLSSQSSLIFNHKSYVEFGCDYDDICQGKVEGKFMKIILKNVSGELFCCNSSKCNLPQLTPLPKQALKCYHAKKSGEGAIVGCSSSGGHCAATREFHIGPERRQFFCDNENICNKNASIITEGCKNISLDNNTKHQVEICCCTKDLCNKPPWEIVTSTATPINDNTTTPLLLSKQKHIDWSFIGGLLAMLALMGGLIVGAVVFVKKGKKKENDPGLRFSYRRIRADQLEDTEIGDNVRLVIT